MLASGEISGQERPASAPSGLCYAFARGGDVWTVCQGKRERIDLGGKALDFAASADGARFVAVWEKAGTYPKHESPPGEMLQLSLKGNAKSEVKEWSFDLVPGRLYPSCGTIVTISRDPALQGRLGLTYDVSNGELLNPSSYKALRCSSDRSVMAGLKNPEDPFLFVSNPKERKLTAASFLESFDVSPSGKYVAYFRQPKPSTTELCAVEKAGEPVCVEEDSGSTGRLSVSDSSEVIYEGADGACYFHDGEHYSRKPLRGYPQGDVCPVVAYWHPGRGNPTIIESPGGHPQWITPDVAAALHSWNSQRAHERKKRP